MEKEWLLALSLAFAGGVSAQTFHVDSTVQKKKALLEEFTGHNCYWCTDGARVATQLLNALGDSAWVVAVHTGSLSGGSPDYTIAAGDSLGVWFDSERAGYPSGLVNRTDFYGNGTYTLSRSNWIEAAKVITAQDAPVNLWQHAAYDGATRTLSVRVEAFFTAAEPSHGQRLNVVLTQDDIVGWQNGGGDDYHHNHMLRATLTPVGGEAVGDVARGSRLVREYAFVVPDSIGDVAVRPEDLTVVTFVTDGRADVLNVTGGKPDYDNYGLTPGAMLSDPDVAVSTRYGFNFFETKVKNLSAIPLSELTFTVTQNDAPETVTVPCQIGAFSQAGVTVPVTLRFSDKDRDKYRVALDAVNGEAVEGGVLSGTFRRPKVSTSTVYVELMTDIHAAQNRFLLRDADGNVLREFGPYEDGVAATYHETVEGLEEGKTYCIEVTDRNGDGLNDTEWDGTSSSPRGGLITRTATGHLIDQFYQIDGFGIRSFFTIDTAAGISENVRSGGKAEAKAPSYSLAGQRVGDGYKGVVVRNGRKAVSR